MERIGFQKMGTYLRPGDTVVIESFSRISRSTKDLLQLINEFQIKNVLLISLKENYDYNTPNGKMYLVLLSALVKFEREILLERQKEGIAEAKKMGKYKGRKKIVRPNNFDSCYRSYFNKENNYSYNDFMADTGLKRSTLYWFIRRNKEMRASNNK